MRRLLPAAVVAGILLSMSGCHWFWPRHGARQGIHRGPKRVPKPHHAPHPHKAEVRIEVK